MNQEVRFEGPLARQYSMVYGTIVGILASLSFLCSMYGMSHASLGMMSNILGLAALFVVVRKLREHRQRVQPLTFGQACWMTVMIYFYAILFTAVVQYIYFAFLDKGQLQAQMHQILSIPQYHQMLEQIAGEEDIDAMVQNALNVFATPAKATMQLMWINCIVSLFLAVPTALAGITGEVKKLKS